MPARHVLPSSTDDAFARLRLELDIPEGFPADVQACAAAAARRGPRYERIDATDLPLVTIDPPGSRDLDQAVHVQRTDDGGLTVRSAIADVAAFVEAGDPVDVEAWDRGVSRYSPDLVTPLHPEVLSAGAASLLPGQDRAALLWTMQLDEYGTLEQTQVERALVRSRAQLTYADAQQAIDSGTDEMLVDLALLGRLRTEREWVRGGISLELPDQEVFTASDGRYDLRYRAPLPVEGWNAQISLLTGIAAGEIMATAGVGVLRTLPPADEATVQGLRRRAWALGLPWPREVGYAEFVRTLDPHQPTQAAMISVAAVGLRGAGYVSFDGDLPSAHRHEAIASTYAHVTAPLRRLVDRFGGEVALAITTGQAVPEWVRDRLADLPQAMAQARGRAGALDRAVLDLVEAQVLADRIGEVFPATVVRTTERGSELQLREPAVTARIPTGLPLGTVVMVRLYDVDLAGRAVIFELA